MVTQITKATINRERSKIRLIFGTYKRLRNRRKRNRIQSTGSAVANRNQLRLMAVVMKLGLEERMSEASDHRTARKISFLSQFPGREKFVRNALIFQKKLSAKTLHKNALNCAEMRSNFARNALKTTAYSKNSYH